ncbi:uncharacterized protein BO88DRAFT_427642 [Aspergillus vadensis CBS 113365]|uniref:Heterokaryon incompatibility domain-containing protein n=1 Tax=Aspergillus vadensis (strain CBS 113365 / IMI 142717 / IBT 24658) TaxID=1448311 RepID=A0A319BLL7_ASPVC|nr:hypothetical protein BO88DRAFT_427642 [Aspergillus vadensis CBS 113365]PYH66553.1 hypothetical protein BO88DRAFT_427642 [Aspergillus vadensis CBS 113365]
MSRWHNSSCKRPDVSVAGGIPCCNHCFAIAIIEQETRLTDSPLPLNDLSHISLWPSCPDSNSLNISEESTEHGDSEPRTDYQEIAFPTLPSKDHIRLVRLNAGPFDSMLHVDLEVVNIHNCPAESFEVLSYASVNENEDSGSSHIVFVGKYWDTVHVSYNCQQALRFVRNQEFDRLLWVDSLCIDDANLKEKSQQTSLKRKICQKASKVLAYLCEETSDSREALDFLNSIAITDSEVSTGHEHINKENRRALRILLERPLFTRLWFLVEALLARNLELLCGANSAPWPKAPFALAHEDIEIFLPILAQVSSYECSDPRDKVFAVLSLISQSELIPDYTVSVERIYTELAAYLIKVCNTMDVLESAGLTIKTFDLPSWVPDWSQALSTTATSIPTNNQRLSRKYNKVSGSGRVIFRSYLAFDCESHLSAATPILRTSTIKICGLGGSIKRGPTRVKIRMALDERATLSDKQGQDSLYLLGGYNNPVILREDSVTGSYHFVSTCALSLRQPHTSRWLLPWASEQPNERYIVSGLSPEDNSLIREFHLLMEQTTQQSVPLGGDDEIPIPFASIRDRVFNFSLWLQSPLPRLEKQLWDKWEDSNREFGWMFRDQHAAWQFLRQVNSLQVAGGQGEFEMLVDKFDDIQTTLYCGVKLPWTYSWDLSRFVWSFLRPLTPEQAAQGPQWTPVLGRMMTALPKIIEWAETTEQLLKLFEYSQTIFGARWASFPGNGLPQKWIDNYENFYKILNMDINRFIADLRTSLDSSCHWDIREFEHNARARCRLWDLNLPPELESGSASNIAVHAGFRSLGLELYDEQKVDIL